MSIIKPEYKHLQPFNPNNHTQRTDIPFDFDMDVTYPGEAPVNLLTDEEYERDLSWLSTNVPEGFLRTFIVGSFTNKYRQDLGQLDPEYVSLIESVHQYYERFTVARRIGKLDGGIQAYSCFRREKYGRIGIASEYATVLDKIALERSHFLTLLPGAADSHGTWKEIVYATRLGIAIVGLHKEDDPEESKFRQRIIENAESNCPRDGLRSALTFITFECPDDLFAQLGEVTKEMLIGK